jgi:hypothetical protein
MEVDQTGSHFMKCPLLDQRTHHHNTWRDTMAGIVRKAGMSVNVESSPEGTRSRPGDILIPGWRNGRPIAVDFAIVADLSTDAPDRVAHGKRQLYQHMCEEAGWDFIPVVGDVFGAVRAESEKFLHSLCKQLSEELGPGFPTPQTLFWQSVSTCLIRRAAGGISEAWRRGFGVHPLATPVNNEMEGVVVSSSSPTEGAGISSAQPLSQVEGDIQMAPSQ